MTTDRIVETHRSFPIYFSPESTTGGFMNQGHSAYYWHELLSYQPFSTIEEARASIDKCMGIGVPGCMGVK